MKIAVVNYTGTVGKTIIAAHLLSPRMGNIPIIAVETVNQTATEFGADVEQMSGNKFRDLFRKLLNLDDAIIDVGASNIEAFLNGMVRFEESHLEFDCFLIPVTSGTKEQKETIFMMNNLLGLGIEAEKIKLVFNRVENNVKDEFPLILNYMKNERHVAVNTEAAIFENELFDALNIKQLTIGALLNDGTDYKALLRNNPDASGKDKNHWADMYGLKALAKGVNRNLDGVYSTLFNS